MKLSELKAICLKAIYAVEALERQVNKDTFKTLTKEQTPLGKLEILFRNLSELAAMLQFWREGDDDEDLDLGA